MRTRSLRNAAITSVLFTALSFASLAHAQDGKLPEEARQNFEAGVALLQDPAKPRYEEAYRRFKAAYAAAPVPRILGNLGLCAMKLERDAEAIDSYERYLKGVPDIEPAERAQIERDLLTLRTGAARILVSSDPPGAQLVDSRITTTGEDITNAYGPINAPTELVLRQGHHIIRARLPDRPEVVFEFDAIEGRLPAKVFVIPAPEAPLGALALAPPPPERPTPTAVYVTGTLTGVLAAASITTGILAIGKKNDFESANDGREPEHADHLRGNAQTLNTVTDVLLVGTAVMGIATAYLYFTRPAVDRPKVGRLQLRF